MPPSDGGAASAAASVDRPEPTADSGDVRGPLAIAVVLGVACSAGAAAASPRADVVITWAPGRAQVVKAVAGAARTAGAAAIDASPTETPVLADAAALRDGRAAYEALRFEEALVALTRAAQSVERSGAAGLSNGELFDLFLYRALTEAQLGDAAAAWDDFVRAATVDPSRTLDPALLPPKALEQLERARAHVAKLPRRSVELRGEAGCEVMLDARPTTAREEKLVRGRHWIWASCPGRRTLARGFDVEAAEGAAGTREETPLGIAAAGERLPSFGDDAALVQARTAGARAALVVTVAGDGMSAVALLRRIGVDGREQERRSIELGEGGAGSERALASEVQRMLAPEPAGGATATPWYRSRWTWAAAGVVAASAVLLPFVLLDDDSPGVVIRPEGAPW